jgi:hypothetical protein
MGGGLIKTFYRPDTGLMKSPTDQAPSSISPVPEERSIVSSKKQGFSFGSNQKRNRLTNGSSIVMLTACERDTFQSRIQSVGTVYVTGFTDDCTRYRVRQDEGSLE